MEQRLLIAFVTLVTIQFGSRFSTSAQEIDSSCQTTPARGNGLASPTLTAFTKGLELSKLAGERDSLWARLRTLALALESTNPTTPKFSFECLIDGPTNRGSERNRVRIMVHRVDSLRRAAIFGTDNLPSSIYSNANWFVPMDGRWIQHNRGRWGLVFDSEHLTQFLDPSAVPAGESCVISFQPIDFIRGIIGDATPDVLYHATSRTVVLQTKATSVQIRLRSPDDALQYGTELGEVFCKSENGAHVVFRAFETSSAIDKTAQSTDEQVALLLRSIPATQQDRSRLNGYQAPSRLLEDSVRQPAQELSKVIALSYAPPLKSNAVTDALNVLTTVEESFGKSLDLNSAKRLASNLVGAIRRLEESRLGARDTTWCLLSDDPSMRWRRFESAIGNEHAMRLYLAIVNVASIKALPSEVRVALADMAGDIGCPPFFAWEALEPMRTGDGILYAMLATRWRWVCGDDELENCKIALKYGSPGGEVEAAAIESFFLLDAADQIPEQSLNRWFKSRIVQQEAGMRLHNLWHASQHPRGRRLLADQLKGGDLDGAISADIKHVLAHREANSRRFESIINSTE